MPDREREKATAVECDLGGLEARGGPFVEAVEATRMPMLVTDAQESGSPVIYANDAFLRLLGREPDEVVGRPYAAIAGEHAGPEVRARIEAALASRVPTTDEILFRSKDGREVWVSQAVEPMEEDGRVVRHFASYDITGRVRRERALHEEKETLERRVAARTWRLQEAKEKLEEEVERRRRTEATLRDALAQGQEDLRFRDFLVREVDHRAKNALQLAVSLLGVQARASGDPACRGALETAMGRLRRMGEVHALLAYRGSDGPDGIDVPDYLRRLCREMAESLAPSPGRVRVEVDAEEEAVWGPDLAVPLGLMVGEAVTNALKHGFPGKREGRVRVELRAGGGGTVRLSVEDDGVGLPAERRAGSLGLRLIDMFAKQIKGGAAVEDRPGGGTAVAVTFPSPIAPPG